MAADLALDRDALIHALAAADLDDVFNWYGGAGGGDGGAPGGDGTVVRTLTADVSQPIDGSVVATLNSEGWKQ